MSGAIADVLREVKRIYFVGIGGAGMSVLARLMKYRGYEVAGSDLKESDIIRELRRLGVEIHIGQCQSYVAPHDLVVYSTAIPPEHVELKAARDIRCRIWHRADLLSSLMNSSETSIAVTGTHGKTTTTAMISYVLTMSGREPTCLIGGEILNLSAAAIPGRGNLFVSEVDESDKSHRLYKPHYAIITNLEEDHMDHYQDLQELEISFEDFVSHTRTPGLIVYPAEDPFLRHIVRQSGKPCLSFGFNEEADWSAHKITFSPYGTEFELYEAGFYTTTMRLAVPGRHNVANALAATALLTQLGVDLADIVEFLGKFRGARRRLEVKYESPELVVVDDYAHHPTEVKASLAALRQKGMPMTVIFQPHRFSRTKYFFREFAAAFKDADQILLTDVYGAGEPNPDGIEVHLIYDELLRIRRKHTPLHIVPRDRLLSFLLDMPKLQGVIAFLGAGDIGEIANEFADRLKIFAAA